MSEHEDLYQEMYLAVATKWGTLLALYDLDPDSSPKDVIEAVIRAARSRPDRATTDTDKQPPHRHLTQADTSRR